MQLGFALVLLPAVLVGIAAAYERWLVGERRQALLRAAEAAAHASDAERNRLAARTHALIARLDAKGAVVARWPTGGTTLDRSAVGSVGERLVGTQNELSTLDRADGLLPPWTDRDEVQSALAGTRAFGRHLTPGGAALVVALAEPLPDGGALYLLSGSHRGIRRLAVGRRQLIQLLLYEAVVMIPLVLLFSVGLVRPLERLAAAARRYPAAPLADPALLRRRDEIGALARTLAEMAADLDARRQAAAELGADVAHEFKNPLATIAASAELLSAGKPATAERLELISSTIGQSVERLRRSIDDLLRLLRMEQAIAGEARAPVALGDVLQAVADEYRRDPRAAGWRFDVQAPAELATLAPTLNRARWLEMLRNLIENALVQPAVDMRIVLGLRRQGSDVVTFVRDHGPGISAENQRRIFDRFFTQRPDGTAPGTGLGLSIVDSVARSHGAEVRVQSTPGEGAEFQIVLPA